MIEKKQLSRQQYDGSRQKVSSVFSRSNGRIDCTIPKRRRSLSRKNASASAVRQQTFCTKNPLTATARGHNKGGVALPVTRSRRRRRTRALETSGGYLRRRRSPPSPTSPLPMSRSVAGSGTGAGSSPVAVTATVPEKSAFRAQISPIPGMLNCSGWSRAK